MADKAVINLSTGLEDGERVTVAFLVAGGALEQGRQVAMFLSKEAVRLALTGVADAVACDGCPPLARLFQQFAEGGGELLVCPVCFNSKKLDKAQLVDNARLAGATPLWQWIGEDTATVFARCAPRMEQLGDAEHRRELLAGISGRYAAERQRGLNLFFSKRATTSYADLQRYVTDIQSDPSCEIRRGASARVRLWRTRSPYAPRTTQ